MATIDTAIRINDMVSGPMQHMSNAINMTLNSFQNLDSGANVNFGAIRQEVAEANAGLRQMEEQAQAVGQAARSAETGFKGWQKSIIVANQAIGLVQNTLGRLGVFDVSGAFDRMDTMTRFQKTVSVMTGDAGAANAALAQLKDTTQGTAYGLDVASKAAQGFLTRGMSLGAATEQVRIWSDAVSFYGEGTNEQLNSVVDAIGKMYSKGTVEADQLDRLFDAGIGAAEIYAKAVGQSVSQVKTDLSKGTISAAQFIDTVSQAMDAGMSHGAAKDAGATWATTFSNVGAAITRGWVEVIEGLDAALAARGLPSTMEMVAQFGASVEGMLGHIGSAMGTVVTVVSTGYEVLSTVGSFIADNWSILVPIISGVAAAIALYEIHTHRAMLMDMAHAGVQAVATAGKIVATAATWLFTNATLKAAAEQWKLNTALCACPITWIVGSMIAIITVLYIVIAVINKVKGTTYSATGVVVGVLATAGAFIWNLFSSLVNGSISLFAGLWNFLMGLGNFFANFLRDPLGAAAHLIASFCETALNLLSSLAGAVDTIFGTDWVSSINGWIGDLHSWADSVGNGTYREVAPRINPQDYYLNRKSYSGAYSAGYQWGKGAGSKLKDALKLRNLPSSKLSDAGSLNAANLPSGLTGGVGNIDKNTGSIKDAVKSSSEDLKLIRELAERQAINKYTTATIKVDMTGMTNQISGSQDIDGIMNDFTKKLRSAIIAGAEGVHT